MQLSDRGVKRGQFASKGRARQLILFEGMEYQHMITPTDIDLMIEYRDTTWIICEIKEKSYYEKNIYHHGLNVGQEKLLQRFVDDMKATGKTAIALVAVHEKPIEEDVIAKDCIVKQVYSSVRPEWKSISSRTVKNVIDNWIGKYGDGKQSPGNDSLQTLKNKHLWSNIHAIWRRISRK